MTISNAFKKTFGHNYKNYKGDIGLEIETETKNEYTIPKFSFWDVHADGSLRGFGMEYVLKQPLDFEKTFPEALKEFKDKTKDIPFVKDSITTSVHVHLNLLNDDFVALGNFLTTYAFVENILIRFSGDDRLSNLFCLPICDAEETYHNILKIAESLPKKRYGNLQFDVDSTKYGALNLSALVRYGSLEIRSFRGTTDTELIHTWTGVLYSILKYARQKGLTPPQIIQAYKDRGSEILSDIFGEYRKIIRHKDEDSLLEQNLWYAVNIACAVKDWTKLEEVTSTAKPKLKDLDKISQKLYATGFENLTHEQQQNVLHRAGQGEGEAQTAYTLNVDTGPTVAQARGNWTDTITIGRPLETLVREDRRRDLYEILIRPDDEWDWDADGLFPAHWEGRDFNLNAWEMLVRDRINGEVYVREIEEGN